MHDGGDVDLHHLKLAFHGQRRELAPGTETGVINQDVDIGAVCLEMLKDSSRGAG